MTISTSSLEGQSLMQLSHKIVLNSQDKNGKTALFFSLVFDFKEKKKMMWQHRVSAHHTVHFLTFKIESRGAIVDEAPKAKIDSFAVFDFFFIKTVNYPFEKPCNHRFIKEIEIVIKKNVPSWRCSSSYCAFLEFFDIKSRGAIVDEAQS